MSMAPQKGNDHASVCKGRENKKEDWKPYCAHVAEGYLKESFVWRSKDGTARATYRIIKYIEEKNADVCEALLLEMAEAENLFYWEKLGKDLACGNNSKGEGWVLANNMFNRFKNQLGWRLTDKNVDDEALTAANQQKEDKVAAMAEGINNGSKS